MLLPDGQVLVFEVARPGGATPLISRLDANAFVICGHGGGGEIVGFLGLFFPPDRSDARPANTLASRRTLCILVTSSGISACSLSRPVLFCRPELRGLFL